MQMVTLVTLKSTVWANGYAVYDVWRGVVEEATWPETLTFVDFNAPTSSRIDRFVANIGQHVCYRCVENFYAAPDAPSVGVVWPSRQHDCREYRTEVTPRHRHDDVRPRSTTAGAVACPMGATKAGQFPPPTRQTY